MLKSKMLFLVLALIGASALHAQKLPTATKPLDIQAGGGFVYGQTDYGRTMTGYGIYGDLDFRSHFGAELEYHQANGTALIYERTYEAGLRYFRHYGRLAPYAKILGGRGVFNFPPYFPGGPSSANLAYNLVAVGGGADYRVRSYLNVRGDFEYQDWASDPGFLPNGLTPYLFTVGVAYHFR
jgi:hypothetical protein